ncbi:MAG: sensor histidine kinase [Planctomycetota bacterium]
MMARVDQNRIRQALANILDNALKYTPEQGRIRIKTEETAREFLIHIRDSGIGIQESEMPRIEGLAESNGSDRQSVLRRAQRLSGQAQGAGRVLGCGRSGPARRLSAAVQCT